VGGIAQQELPGAPGLRRREKLIRREDHRYLRGCGRFVADIALPGMMDVAFVSQSS